MWMREALGEARLRGLSERERRAAWFVPARRLLRRDALELVEEDELEREVPELELDERERERELEPLELPELELLLFGIFEGIFGLFLSEKV